MARTGGKMLRDPAYDWPVITADELRDARVRAGYTSQAQLADALGVSLRTVTSWEAEGGHVSPRSEARVRALLWPSPAPLSHYSDYELLSEIGRRLDRLRAAETQALPSNLRDPNLRPSPGAYDSRTAGDLGDKPTPPRRAVQGKAVRRNTPRSARELTKDGDL